LLGNVVDAILTIAVTEGKAKGTEQYADGIVTPKVMDGIVVYFS